MEDGVVNYISETLTVSHFYFIYFQYQKRKVEGSLIKMAENVKFFSIGLFHKKKCTLDGATQRFIMRKEGNNGKPIEEAKVVNK